MLAAGLLAPDLGEALVAAAAGAVEEVSKWVLLGVVLVLVLGRIEGARRDDLARDRLIETLAFRECLL